ncbi:MAG: Fis family transcriptional regulator [Deltaproteobacteria bacterium]|nr:MAG: Fis family transcriptional regulator [Deltaproteobacteria bacterium]
MAEHNKHVPDDVTETILESISDGVFTVNHEWRIMSFNRAAEEITGIPRKEAIGRYCWEVFRSNMCEGNCALKRTMKEGKPFVASSAYIINSEKKRIPIQVSTSLLKNEKKEIIGGVETFRDNSLLEDLRKELTGTFHLGDMVSNSPAMKQLFTILPKIAESDSTVLIEGETGTGKEMVARAIHRLSPRSKAPFIAINCGAMPDALLESELFGYKAGAFTSATRDKQGIFAAASGGTLLLDELGSISPAFQVKLLRVLEEREFQPLGGITPQKTDVRILAATNDDLAQLIEQGHFRRDLYYRINIVRVQLPPLRQRKEDIPLLIEQFLKKINKLRGKSAGYPDSEAMRLIMEHDYPGNIRELENIIEHALVLCSQGQIVPDSLPGYLSAGKTAVTKEKETSCLGQAIASTEAELIFAALRRNGNNRTAAARELGMHKSTLFRKVKRLGIQLPSQDGRSPSPVAAGPRDSLHPDRPKTGNLKAGRSG